MKKFGLPTVFLRYFVDRKVSESDRDVRERDESGREDFSYA